MCLLIWNLKCIALSSIHGINRIVPNSANALYIFTVYTIEADSTVLYACNVP